MTRTRKFVLAAALVVAALAVAGVALVASFDPNAYKGLAIDWMKTHRDRTLAIDGPISLSLFPRLKVRLADVTLSEHGRRDEFAHLGEVSLSVAVMPLLRKRLQVDRIEARGLRAVWRRAADGSTNIDDLLDKEKDKEPPADGGPAGEALAFDISGIRLEDLRLTVHDALAGLDGDATVVKLETGRLADGVESPVDVDAQLALTRPAIAGRLQGQTRLALDLARGGIALRGMALAWQGDAFGVKALALKLTGDLSHDRAAGTVTAKDFDATVSAGLGALRLDGSQLGAKSFTYDPARQKLALDALKLRVAGTQDGHPLRASLDWPALAVDGERLSGGPLAGEVKLEGPLALEATFKSGAPSGSFKRVAVPGLQTTFKGTQGPRQLAGTVRADLALDAAAKSLAVTPLAAQLSITEPSLQPLAVKAQGRLNASAETAAWTLAGDINGNPFETDGQAGLADRPMSIRANASFRALDLNRVLPPAAPARAGSGPAVAKSGDAGDATPIDLSALRSLQGRVSLRAGTFVYRQYQAANLVLDATLRDGVLKASPLSADLWRGRVAGSMEAAATGRVAVKATADGIDVQALLKDVADKDLLEGRGRVTADVTASGRTVGALKKSLDGSAALQLRDGAIKGINLAQRLRQAKAALSMKGDAAATASTTEKTDFSELTASFAIADGIARNKDLAVKSPFLRLGGEGLVDVPQSRVDYTLRTTVADTSKGQGGAELDALRGVTVPVRLTGPLDAVQWQIRWSEVAADLLKSEAGRRVEQQLKDKLGEKLGLPPASASQPAGAASRPEDLLKDRLRRLIK